MGLERGAALAGFVRRRAPAWIAVVCAAGCWIAVIDLPWHYLGPLQAELVSILPRGKNSVDVVPVQVRLPNGQLATVNIDMILAGDLREGEWITLQVHRSLLWGRHTYDGAIPARYLPPTELAPGKPATACDPATAPRLDACERDRVAR